jgi:hypothetical protein
MDTAIKPSRALGAAFLLQFMTSFISGVFLLQPLVVPGNISRSMLNIANQPLRFQATILLDMLTALGIIFLGAMLFVTLRKQGEKMALVALGFYFLEAALLAASRMAAFSLLRISQEYVITGQPEYLQSLGSLALESMDFVGGQLHMLVFCFGAILFYYLLDKSKLFPRVLSLWGLITVPFLLIWTLLAIFGYEVSFYLYLPYVPFEFVIGIWILFTGINVES